MIGFGEKAEIISPVRRVEVGKILIVVVIVSGYNA